REEPFDLLGGEKPQLAQNIWQRSVSACLTGGSDRGVQLVLAEELEVDREAAEKGLVRRQIHEVAMVAAPSSRVNVGGFEVVEKIGVVRVAGECVYPRPHR